MLYDGCINIEATQAKFNYKDLKLAKNSTRSAIFICEF